MAVGGILFVRTLVAGFILLIGTGVRLFVRRLFVRRLIIGVRVGLVIRIIVFVFHHFHLALNKTHTNYINGMWCCHEFSICKNRFLIRGVAEKLFIFHHLHVIQFFKTKLVV